MGKTKETEKWFESIYRGEVEEIRGMILNGFTVNMIEKEIGNGLHQIGMIEENKKKEALEITKLLIENGADLENRDKYGDTPLTERKIIKKFPEVTEMLIDAGANIHQQDDWGNDVLANAMLYDRTKLIDLLIQSGKDINGKNKRGKTYAENAEDYQHKVKMRVYRQLLRFEDKLNNKQKQLINREKLRILF